MTIITLFIQNGYTALMYAAVYGYIDMVTNLIQLGADANIKNNVSYIIFKIS